MDKKCNTCRYYDRDDKWCLVVGESKNDDDECCNVDDKGNLFWTKGKIQDWVINYDNKS